MHKDVHALVVLQSEQTNNYTNPKLVNTIVLLEIIKKIQMLKNLDWKLYLPHV